MLIVAFGESTMSRTLVQLWYNRYKEEWEYGNDDARTDRQSTSATDEEVKNMILEIHRITIRKIADDVGISFSSCQAIFTDVLDMKR